jgi:hypothetical protein
MSLETPTPDAFSMLRDLIALAADPSATRARLEKVQKAIDKAAAAEQRLTEQSSAFDQKVATEKAALDEGNAALNAKALELMGREAAAEKLIQRENSARQTRRSSTLAGARINGRFA